MKTKQPTFGLSVDLNSSYAILTDFEEHDPTDLEESEYQDESELDTSYTNQMLYKGAVTKNRKNLKAKKSKGKRNNFNLDYNNDIALPKVVNKQISIQKEQHQQSKKNYYKRK